MRCLHVCVRARVLAYPMVTIAYNGAGLPVEARVGYLGSPGVLTGFSSAGIGISGPALPSRLRRIRQRMPQPHSRTQLATPALIPARSSMCRQC